MVKAFELSGTKCVAIAPILRLPRLPSLSQGHPSRVVGYLELPRLADH